MESKYTTIFERHLLTAITKYLTNYKKILICSYLFPNHSNFIIITLLQNFHQPHHQIITTLNGAIPTTQLTTYNIPEDEISKKLPKEILLRILSYLDVISLCRCAQVSQKRLLLCILCRVCSRVLTNGFFFYGLQVSKYWNILALDGSNWQKIDLFDFQRDIEVGLTMAELNYEWDDGLSNLLPWE